MSIAYGLVSEERTIIITGMNLVIMGNILLCIFRTYLHFEKWKKTYNH